ncbi:MAG: hypothetical protein GEV11_16410 [Streptosporangiales bacterium]|nr:hypothetical protein [Streptosporangiales bacterium]
MVEKEAGGAVAGDRAGLGRVLRVTALAAVLPGAGYIAVRRQHVGALLLTVQLTLAVVLAVVLLRHRHDFAPLFVSPEVLDVVRVAAPVVGLAWGGAVLHCTARSGHGLRSIEDRILCGIAALAVATAIALPLVTAGRYAAIQRDLMLHVFAPDGAPPADAPRNGTALGTGTAVRNVVGADRFNVLLLGGDGGARRLGLRTDSITVASIDRRTGDTVLFGLPRDLERPPFAPGGPLAERFPGGFDDRLAAVYPFGQGHPELLPGAAHPGGAAAAQAAGQVLGLPIDNFVLVDMAGFADLVDAWGGLPMTVRRPLPFASNGRYLKPGTYTLSGQDALRLARTRHGGGDYARMGRHRCVLAALAGRPGPLTLALRFEALVNAAKRSITTDIPRSRMPELVHLARRLPTASFTSVQLTPPVLNPADPDFRRAHRAVAAALAGRTATPKNDPPPATCPA